MCLPGGGPQAFELSSSGSACHTELLTLQRQRRAPSGCPPARADPTANSSGSLQKSRLYPAHSGHLVDGLRLDAAAVDTVKSWI